MSYLILVVLEVELGSDILEHLVLEPFEGIDVETVNFLGGLCGNVLNGHATLLGVDESGHGGGTIKGEGQVQLTIDADLLDDVDRVAGETVLARLLRHEGLAEHVLSNALNLLGSINNVDTALESGFLEVTETATTSKNLRLDDISVRLECL